MNNLNLQNYGIYATHMQNILNEIEKKGDGDFFKVDIKSTPISKMKAKFYDEQTRELQETEVQEAPPTIRFLFSERIIPYIWNGKIYGLAYEREIDSLYIHTEITNEEIYKRVSEEIAKINLQAMKEAQRKTKELLLQINKELQEIAPPWWE